MNALTQDLNYYYEAKGLISMVKDAQTGATIHKAANLLMGLMASVQLYENNGYFKNIDRVESILKRSKDFVREAQ